MIKIDFMNYPYKIIFYRHNQITNIIPKGNFFTFDTLEELVLIFKYLFYSIVI